MAGGRWGSWIQACLGHLLPAASEADSKKEGGGQKHHQRLHRQGSEQLEREGAIHTLVYGVAPPAAVQHGGPGDGAEL